MSLKDKFDFHAQWQYYEKMCEEAPDMEIHAAILTSEKIDKWPEGVKHSGTYFPHHNGKNHIYTISARTGDFEKFCNQPVVLQISL